MLGLAVMLVALLYFVILFTATIGSYLLLRKSKKNRKVSALVSLIVFSVIFVPVFWDYYPNKLMYSYYCKNEAGFFQYKTIEQWKAENPGVWETLRPYSYDEQRIKKIYLTIDGDNYFKVPLNEHISMLSFPVRKKINFNIKKDVRFLFDEKNKEVIAKGIEFYSGPGNILELGGKGYKIWLNQKPCPESTFFDLNAVKRQFVNQSLKQEGVKYD